MENVTRIINENPDSIEVGTPGKVGCIKIYGDFNNIEAFEKKIKNAKELRAKEFPTGA